MNVLETNEPLDETLIDAFKVFLRYGYRKTSLDDVAKSVGYSRQTLYQRYKNKERLFVAALEEDVRRCMINCVTIFSESTQDIEKQLLEACNAWWGEYIDTLKESPHGLEIIDVANSLIGKSCADHESAFIELLTRTLKVHGIPASDDKKINTKKVAETICYISKGISHSCKDRNDFLEKMKMTLSIICKI